MRELTNMGASKVQQKMTKRKNKESGNFVQIHVDSILEMIKKHIALTVTLRIQHHEVSVSDFQNSLPKSLSKGVNGQNGLALKEDDDDMKEKLHTGDSIYQREDTSFYMYRYRIVLPPQVQQKRTKRKQMGSGNSVQVVSSLEKNYMDGKSEYKPMKVMKKIHTITHRNLHHEVSVFDLQNSLPKSLSKGVHGQNGLALKEDDNEMKEKLHTGDSSYQREDTSFDMWDIMFQPGFKIKQVLTVCMIDTVTAPQIVTIGNIPWGWLHEEKWRLHTFAKYPQNTSKSALLLAESGFVYNGSGQGSDDSVICVFCRVSKHGWQEYEDIREAHRRLSPSCPMVTGVNSSNIPLIPSTTVAFGQPFRPSGFGTGVNNAIETDSVMADSSDSSSVTVAPAAVSSGIFSQSSQGNSSSNQTASMEGATALEVTLPQTVQIPVEEKEEANTRRGQANSSISANSFSSQSQSRSPVNKSTSSTTIPAQTTQSLPQPPNNTTTTSSTSNLSPPTSNPPATTNNSAPVTNNSSPPTNTPSTPANQTVPQNPTYHELGIITERPKRFEYAVRFKRLETFEDWPVDHHLKKDDVADAGFYYAGYGDCARCFYCGGGLRNWELDDDVWVEHARWFPKCAYIRQRVGQVFVDTVAALAQDNEKISFDMVVRKMNIDPSAFQIDSKDTPLKIDPAVLAIKEMGYQEKDILAVAASLKESSQILSADILYTTLEQKGIVCPSNETNDSQASDNTDDLQKEEELLTSIKQKNNDLRLQTLCKICMDKEVAVVFLPCGHMVCCTECASAMKDCPVCRKQVKGIVRAFMG